MDESDKIHLYLGFILFGISELLPFIKLMKGNGFCDVLYCAFRKSKCMVKKEELEAIQSALEQQNVV